MTAALVAEFTRLVRRRSFVPALAVTIAYAALVTWALLATAGDDPRAEISVPALGQAGGATLAISIAATFTSVLVMALFIGMSAGDHSRGTWRAALLQNPNRLRLTMGTFAARTAVTGVLVVVLFVAGALAARVIAPGYDIDTSAWFGTDGLQAAAENLGKACVYALGWGLFGTVVGVLARSVPLGLALGVAWAGPVENALGEDLDFGQRWFPGLLLRQFVGGHSSLTDAQLGTTLALYALAGVALVALAVTRRDVTS